jgi:hypothetical protein
MWPFKRRIKVSIDPKDEVEIANMQFDVDVKVWRCRGLIMPAYPTWELVGHEGSNCGQYELMDAEGYVRAVIYVPRKGERWNNSGKRFVNDPHRED